MSKYPEVDAIARLLELAARYGLDELEVEEGDLKVTLRAPAPFAMDEEPEASSSLGYLWRPPTWPESGAATAAPAAPGRPETACPLVAPLTGTFYRARSPEAPPLVEVGETVEEGQIIGLIEAMKVFSEIAADRAGVIVEIAVPNGKLVQHGDVLLYIDPVLAT